MADSLGSETISNSSDPTDAVDDVPLQSHRTLRHIIERQKDELRDARDEIATLRAREVQMGELAVQHKQHLLAVQHQLDTLRGTLRMQLASPVTEAEYLRLEAIPDSQRDMVTTIKIGVFQQLGALHQSRETALRRAAELANDVTSLQGTLRSTQQELKELQAVHEHEVGTLRRQLAHTEQRVGASAELTARIAELEAQLGTAFSQQERIMETKVMLQSKMSDLARCELKIKQLEREVERHQTLAASSEEKLEVLKSEYYDTRLQYQQRTMALEHALRVAEQRLEALGNVEQEAEMFINNYALAERDGGNTADAVASIGSSQRMQHLLAVTRRCLALENSVLRLEHAVRERDETVSALRHSLETAREALGNRHQPYMIMEAELQEVVRERNSLRQEVHALRHDKDGLEKRVTSLTADVQVLLRQRTELLKLRQIIDDMRSGLVEVATQAEVPQVAAVERVPPRETLPPREMSIPTWATRQRTPIIEIR